MVRAFAAGGVWTALRKMVGGGSRGMEMYCTGGCITTVANESCVDIAILREALELYEKGSPAVVLER